MTLALAVLMLRWLLLMNIGYEILIYEHNLLIARTEIFMTVTLILIVIGEYFLYLYRRRKDKTAV